jgi:hypothetical protein
VLVKDPAVRPSHDAVHALLAAARPAARLDGIRMRSRRPGRIVHPTAQSHLGHARRT